MRVDTPPPALNPTARLSPAGPPLTGVGPLRAPALPPVLSTLSFGGQLVEALLRNLVGTTTPPGNLQLQMQWQPPAGAPYAPSSLPATVLLSSTTSPDPGGALPEPLQLQGQMPVLTADGRVLTGSLSLSLLPALRQQHPEVAARLEAAVQPGQLGPLQAEGRAETLAGQQLQFQWTDPRALWPLQNLAMRGLLRFSTAAEERDRDTRRRAAQQVLREPEAGAPEESLSGPLADDGGPPRIGVGAWLWFSARSFASWLKRLW
ncbi:MAG TPA: hypothetical protein VLI06_10335 [Solimonas sp.]|nr:hypothetical protein [Solimonas sp.]